MPRNPYILHGLKYATLTLAAAVLLIAAAALMKGQNAGSLSGRLVAPQQSGTTPTVHMDAERALEGFTVPADTNVIFTVPDGIRIPRITFLGGTDYDQNNRYWGYCFSGNEPANKAAGKTGSAIYDGHFFYSLAERKAQTKHTSPADSDLVGILQSGHQSAPEEKASVAEIFNGNETCFAMSSIELPAGIDSDNDDINSYRERILGTDPNNPDTDGDGISDGVEVFVMKTSPTDGDTDHDGLGDACEDKNRNGSVDRKETSALNVDTDRDGLCDGDGSANGCPEKKQTVCSNDADGNRVCEIRPSSPVSGEDMNQDCLFQAGSETDPTNPQTYGINDWDYKWNQFGGEPTVGTVAPDFPIPEMPAR